MKSKSETFNKISEFFGEDIFEGFKDWADPTVIHELENDIQKLADSIDSEIHNDVDTTKELYPHEYIVDWLFVFREELLDALS